VKRISLRFVKWGTGLLVLGVWTGYGPLHHYLHGGVEVSCPWAPVHGHVALLGWIGFTIFGLVYRALPDWGTPGPNATRLATAHFWLSVLSVLGVYANGIFGYRYLDRISPSFYYLPEKKTLGLWLSIDGCFLTLYGIGAILFLLVVFGSMEYDDEATPPGASSGGAAARPAAQPAPPPAAAP
jgi:heme/copper-type cytochrome/quinol oxidase subunit 1